MLGIRISKFPNPKSQINADSGGFESGTLLKTAEKCMSGMPMRVAQAAWSLLLSREIT
jgi:hypothetical protein